VNYTHGNQQRRGAAGCRAHEAEVVPENRALSVVTPKTVPAIFFSMGSFRGKDGADTTVFVELKNYKRGAFRASQLRRRTCGDNAKKLIQSTL
jgi:hypothetical protein